MICMMLVSFVFLLTARSGFGSVNTEGAVEPLCLCGKRAGLIAKLGGEKFSRAKFSLYICLFQSIPAMCVACGDLRFWRDSREFNDFEGLRIRICRSVCLRWQVITLTFAMRGMAVLLYLKLGSVECAGAVLCLKGLESLI